MIRRDNKRALHLIEILGIGNFKPHKRMKEKFEKIINAIDNRRNNCAVF